MNKDLEDQLNEMGPAYRAVVARLRAAQEAESLCRSSRSSQSSRSSGTNTARKSAYLVAASLLVFVGLGVFFLRPLDFRPKTQDASFGAREYRASVSEMIATQNPDGSWQNDFLTRRNAETLKLCVDPAAQVAYRKAVRNLRVRGVL